MTRPFRVLAAVLAGAALLAALSARPAPARAQTYDLPQCIADLAGYGIEPDKVLAVCTTLAASVEDGQNILTAFLPCGAVLANVIDDDDLIVVRCVDVIYAAPPGVPYDVMAQCTLDRILYGYTDDFGVSLSQCAEHPYARLSIAGRWQSEFGPVDITELENRQQWVADVFQRQGSTDLGGNRQGSALTFVYRNRFDDDEGAGRLTLSDDGCVLAGSFQSDKEETRRGGFRLQRCPD